MCAAAVTITYRPNEKIQLRGKGTEESKERDKKRKHSVKQS